MKTLKTSLAALLTIISICSFAADKENKKRTMDNALTTFIDAINVGKTEGVAEVLDRKVKYITIAGNRTIKYGRRDVLRFLKENQNLVQNCVTATTIMEATAESAVVEVKQKYDHFTAVKTITLKNSNDGWKICQVVTSFE